jgi:hypothetical protein
VSGLSAAGPEAAINDKTRTRKLLLITAVVLVTVTTLALVFGEGSGTSSSGSRRNQLEVAATDILWDVYGRCFNLPGGKQALKETTIVRQSSEIEGVITASVYLQNIATGKKETFDFRINTGLGSYRGVPQPGTGIPNNDEARRVVRNC